MNDWREDGQAAHEYETLMQEREEWLHDQQAQAEYQDFLTSKEEQNEMER
jgi:hypothetical protein